MSIWSCMKCRTLHGPGFACCKDCGGGLEYATVVPVTKQESVSHTLTFGSTETAYVLSLELRLESLKAAVERALTFYQTTHIHAVLQAALRGDNASVEATGVDGRTRPALGHRVRWTSQAQGAELTKEGFVVEVVAAERKPDRDRFLSLHRGNGCGAPRNHESYVVAVDETRYVYGNKKAKTYKTPKIYWPRANALHIVQTAD